ncbi:MAG TPA: sigma-70 family RNA polymerase sigma factor [Sedimentisphaerales bacterium]|nr:sigma-70 family RNA polymerase sigma factor [Sedimentisphaerales bacterium]
MQEDTRLIWRLKRGEREALRRLYEKYKNKLLAIAALLLNDGNAAEDIVHDVFVSLAAGIRWFEFRGKLENYLITCVVNRVRDRFRRKQYEVVEIRRLGQIGSNSPGPEQSAMFSEETQLLMDGLARLPFEQREVIILHLKGGMKFREIAAAQGVPVSTAQARYRYGLDKLRFVLNAGVIG